MNYISYVGIPFVVSKEQAFNSVCEVFELTPIQLRSRSRLRHIVEAKAVLCYILHKKQGLTSLATGEYLKLNHATVLHHCKNVANWIEVDKNFNDKFKQLRVTYN